MQVEYACCVCGVIGSGKAESVWEPQKAHPGDCTYVGKMRIKCPVCDTWNTCVSRPKPDFVILDSEGRQSQ